MMALPERPAVESNRSEANDTQAYNPAPATHKRTFLSWPSPWPDGKKGSHATAMAWPSCVPWRLLQPVVGVLARTPSKRLTDENQSQHGDEVPKHRYA